MPIMPIVHQPRRPLGRESFRQRNLGCVPQNLVFRGDMQHPPNLNIDNCFVLKSQLRRYGVRNLEMSIRFSLKSRPPERFHRPEMSQIKAEISLHT